MVQAVTEPLKTRTITKGNTVKYYLAKFFQKNMWNYLQQFKQFELTGTKLEKSHMEWLRKKTDLYFDTSAQGVRIVSGDFSSATDNVSAKCTMTCFEAFLNIYDSIEFRKRPETYNSWRVLSDALVDVIGLQDVEYPNLYMAQGLISCRSEIEELLVKHYKDDHVTLNHFLKILDYAVSKPREMITIEKFSKQFQEFVIKEKPELYHKLLFPTSQKNGQLS